MKHKIIDERTNITYTLVDGVYLPNLKISDTDFEIGRWGRIHKRYLKEHHPVIYMNLLTSCKLNEYLHNIDISAQQQYEILIEQFKQAQGVTEELKSTDQMAWVQAMNNIENQVKEIICNDIIYKT